jgi:hypothetical protein
MTAIQDNVRINCDTRVGYTPRQQDELLPGVQRRPGAPGPQVIAAKEATAILSLAVALPTEGDRLRAVSKSSASTAS